MAHEEKDEGVAPPVQSHQVLPPVLPQLAGEVFVPPPSTVESPKEKALEPESKKAVEGVPMKKNDQRSDDPMPSTSEKDIVPHVPIQPSDENASAANDVQPMEISTKVYRKNPQESFPLFSSEYGPNGPAFNEQLNSSKLAFFSVSPYEGERTSLSSRFWTEEQAIYYAWI
jgi:hypothetical protein